MRIFIGNLGSDINTQDLFLLFSGFGKVMHVEVATGNDKKQLGYAYVRMHSWSAAKQAIAALNKKCFMQQYLSVSEAIHGNCTSPDLQYG